MSCTLGPRPMQIVGKREVSGSFLTADHVSSHAVLLADHALRCRPAPQAGAPPLRPGQHPHVPEMSAMKRPLVSDRRRGRATPLPI